MTFEKINNWQIIKLGNCCKENPSYGINAAAVEFNKELPRYIRITDIDDYGRFSPDKLTSVNEKGWEDFVLNEDDVLFVRTGSTTGKSYLYQEKDGELVYAGFLIKFSIDKTILLPYYLKLFTESSFYNQWVSIMSVRSGQPGINSKEFSLMPIHLPPLKEQQKIAEILSKWDEAIETTQNLITQLQLRKKGLMQELLSGKKRLAGFSEEWKEFQFGDLLKDVKRPVDWNDEELYDLISVRRRSGGLFFRESLYGNQILTKNLKTAKTGDFLISKMQIVHGASGLVSEEYDGAKISGSYLSLRVIDENRTDINFINWLSKTPFFYYQTLVSSYGVHIEKMTFNFKLFLKSKIRIPKIEEQRMIVEILETAQSEINNQEEILSQLKISKKGLMQQLLTGQKRVKI